MATEFMPLDGVNDKKRWTGLCVKRFKRRLGAARLRSRFARAHWQVAPIDQVLHSAEFPRGCPLGI